MPHIVLLGDSTLDNGSYTGGKPDVISQVKERIAGGWKASLLAVDGATTRGIGAQLARLPRDASHLVLSVGGNDALGSQSVLSAPARTTAEGLLQLAAVVDEFAADYRKALQACLDQRLPLVTCTIYHGNFADRQYQRQVATALAAFNDVILQASIENRLTVLDLRRICNRPEDYANPIEPSSIGGAKIADAIIHAVTAVPNNRQKAVVLGGPR
ncbi:MAG TPA: SGNH/GDSL hydrolase family protein [Noviherbaspirillum sp.]|uniref:SGNH/GDSL hydrolase family protein n=1 Tax=Noviherbaspirillum sp. TaxID=1926288 RepID=UPI002D2252E9|nr:SGNH/GDSL hydrolase family protein [Noviherbaspirillum sp.]HYD97171.1 SGNH/GDSL hydrolase family protein [Noviherbaspirillum sp.]